MKQLKVESRNSQRILNVMQMITEQEMAEKKQRVSLKFLKAITWYPEKQTLMATDSAMIVVWKVNDSELLKVLKTANKPVHFSYSDGILNQMQRPEGMTVLQYDMFIPKFDAYVKFESLDIDRMDDLGIARKDIMLEYVCICSQARFNPIYFKHASMMTVYDSFEFMNGDKESPIKLKSNKDRIVCLIMPLMKDKIKIMMK